MAGGIKIVDITMNWTLGSLERHGHIPEQSPGSYRIPTRPGMTLITGGGCQEKVWGSRGVAGVARTKGTLRKL